MKTLLLFFLFLSTTLSAQWSVLPVLSAGRHDDICFISASTGWAVASNGKIIHTTDGGKSWELQDDIDGYLRSVEFATPTLGFAGSLNGKLLKTTNGGEDWHNITPQIEPSLPGICGLSSPTAEIIYGCGIWSSPAYIIKSIDGGLTWTTTDMSGMASALVDIHFISADTGFVSGKSPGEFGHGIILYTTDGGLTWSNHYTSDLENEYIWKLQSPDGIHYYGSISNESYTGSTRMAISKDKGLNWTTQVITDTFIYIQTIGFIDSLNGWTGAKDNLLETNDGGATWQSIELDYGYNRFLKINDTTAFMTGRHIYKYSKDLFTQTTEPTPDMETHTLDVFPNPADDYIKINVELREFTPYWLRLYDVNGTMIQSISRSSGTSGNLTFTVSLSGIASQMLNVVLTTNEGATCKKINRT